jgi:hypothetical protein
MSQRMGQEIREIRELRKAGQRLESASKEWDAAYREYLGAVRALSRMTTRGNAPRNRSPKASNEK